MAEVRITAATHHFGAAHEKASILFRLHRFGIDRRPEAGPSGSRIEFRIGAEQWIPTAHAVVCALVFRIVIFTRKRPLSAFLTAYFILLRSEMLFPFLLGFLDFFCFLIALPIMPPTVWPNVSESTMSISAGRSPIVYRKTLRKEERHRTHTFFT